MEKTKKVEIEDGDILTEYFDNRPIAQYIVLDTEQYVLKLYILWIEEEEDEPFFNGYTVLPVTKRNGNVIVYGKMAIEAYLSYTDRGYNPFGIIWTIDKIR